MVLKSEIVTTRWPVAGFPMNSSFFLRGIGGIFANLKVVCSNPIYFSANFFNWYKFVSVSSQKLLHNAFSGKLLKFEKFLTDLTNRIHWRSNSRLKGFGFWWLLSVSFQFFLTIIFWKKVRTTSIHVNPARWIQHTIWQFTHQLQTAIIDGYLNWSSVLCSIK